MKTNIKNRKNKFLALSLSLLMATSVTAFASCTEDNASSSSSSSSSSAATTEKDTGLITNASFKTFNKNDGKNLISKTVSGWTRATISNLTSTSASGVISTASEDWKNLTDSNVDGDPATLTVSQAKAKWDTMTAKDKILFMEAWEDANPDDDIDKKLDFITTYNVDSEDLPTCENPGKAPDAEDDNVLMIHNVYDWNDYDKLGTAQKFTSSSTVTVPAGTAAKFSVWVNTKDLETSNSAGETQNAVDKGAFISVTNSVGNKSMDELEIKNINTQGEWEQYTFYLNSTSYVDTTFSIVLGLGKGSADDRWGHVSGYAFFDEIECEIITREDFTTETASVPTFGFSSDDDQVIDGYKTDDKKFALNYYGEFSKVANYLDSFTSDKFNVTTETSKFNVLYTAADVPAGTMIDDKKVEIYNGLGISQKDKVTAVFNDAAAMTQGDYANNALLQQVYKDYFEGKDFLKNQGKNEQILMMMSPNGAAYTADSGYKFTVPADGYLAVSFFLKTSNMSGKTGAGATLHYGNETYSLSSMDTSKVEPVEIGGVEDVYTGWQQCLFYVKNATSADANFRLSFSFGPTTVIGTTKASYYSGFAAFAGFECYEGMTEAEFASAQSGTYATIVTLNDLEETNSSTNGFDTAATVPSDEIEKGYADLRNYRGVYSDSLYVGGDSKDLNKHESAGLLNKEHAANYTEILEDLGGAGATWESIFGNATQPLVIYNETAQTKAYGYIGSIQKIAANTYKTVSLRMKVSEGATANVYLMDMDNLDESTSKFNNTLSIGNKVSYWYNDDGDLCVMDPSDEHFNEKRDVAFKLQSNGLYLVNKNWTGYKAEYDGKYFANLANYDKDANGNLVVAKGGVSYDYNDKWENEGNDGIAFYEKDGKYYGDKACTVEVSDFATASVPARYEAQANKDLSFTITGTASKAWITVTFYIHTGNAEKNYRLEIWSGSRDGVVNAEGTVGTVNGANSYVIVDANSPNDLDDTSFPENIKDRKAEDGLAGVTIDSFDSVFSFYDSNTFLRYNETIDENKVGNSYDSYLSSSKTAGTAYLKYESATVLELYANYALSEDSVTADPAEDDTTNDDHDHSHAEETNLWLLGSSIAIAAVLLFAVVSLIIRKVWKKSHKTSNVAPKKVKKEKKEKSEKSANEEKKD